MNINLTKELDNSAGVKFGTLTVTVFGDGRTPIPVILHDNTYVGYQDNGLPIMRERDEEVEEAETAKLMAVAIPMAKAIAESNGIDPSIVNFLDINKEDLPNG